MLAVERALQLAAEGASVCAFYPRPPRLDRDVVSQFDTEPEELEAAFGDQVLALVRERFEQKDLAVSLATAEGPVAQVISDQANDGFDLVLIAADRHVWAHKPSLSEMVKQKTAVTVEEVG